jgi:hypothetical protein
VKVVFIDPPSGWRYGFPRSVPVSEHGKSEFNLRQWLLDNGYPEADVDFALKYTRFWTSDVWPRHHKE